MSRERSLLFALGLALVGWDDAAPVVGDAALDAAVTYIDAPACDRVCYDAGPGRRCEGGEIDTCDRLVAPACDQWGCCPVIVPIDVDRDRCCFLYVTVDPRVAPCCDEETLELPEACPRCVQGTPPE